MTVESFTIVHENTWPLISRVLLTCKISNIDGVLFLNTDKSAKFICTSCLNKYDERKQMLHKLQTSLSQVSHNLSTKKTIKIKNGDIEAIISGNLTSSEFEELTKRETSQQITEEVNA